MTTHRANFQRPPRTWRHALPSAENWLCITVGFLLGQVVLLWCLTAVLPNMTLIAAMTSFVWLVCSAALVWVKETGGQR